MTTLLSLWVNSVFLNERRKKQSCCYDTGAAILVTVPEQYETPVNHYCLTRQPRQIFSQTTLILLIVSSCGILGTFFGPDWQLKRRISFPPGGVIRYSWRWLLLRKQCVNKASVPWHLPLMRHHSFVCFPVAFPNDKVWGSRSGENREAFGFFKPQPPHRLWYQTVVISTQMTLSTDRTVQTSLHLMGQIPPFPPPQLFSPTNLCSADSNYLNQSISFLLDVTLQEVFFQTV